MSFIVKGGGPVNWSAVTIDADKNMAGFGLSNMKQVVAAMIGGDLIAKGLGGILIRIPASVANTVLTSAGIGQVPTWAPGGLYLNRYYPANVYLANAAAIRSINRTDAEPAPLSTAHVQNVADDTMLTQQEKPIALTDAEAITTVDQTDAEAPAITQKYDLEQVLEGAVSDDGGVLTTETAAAKNATANDMTVMTAAPAVDDAYYFGSDYVFDALLLNIGTVGNGVWTITWEYYDVDTTWHALADINDGTTNFRSGTGLKTVTWTKDANWTAVAVNGITCFWIRARVSAYTSIVAHPHGTQAWYRRTL